MGQLGCEIRISFGSPHPDEAGVMTGKKDREQVGLDVAVTCLLRDATQTLGRIVVAADSLSIGAKDPPTELRTGALRLRPPGRCARL